METVINVDNILSKIEEHHELHKQTTQELDQLWTKQQEVIKDLITKMKPVIDWYSSNGYIFTHPTIRLRSPYGPILGHDTHENEVIVYNVNKDFLEKIYVPDNEDRKHYSFLKLVKNGHFKDAYDGLMYLEYMMKNYVERNQEAIDELKADLRGRI
jgi:hypothetical protein